jgi:endoglucanase
MNDSSPQRIPHFFKCTCFVIAAFAGIFAASKLSADVLYTGTNLAGADFGDGNLPGIYNTHYTYPTPQEVDYYVEKGMNTFRIPFRWERLQQSQNATLNTIELGRLESIVNYATNQGAHVVLDPHNYARYFVSVVGSGSLPYASFNDFWARLANEFKDNDKVIFGLMNEPNTMPTEQWGAAAQGAINAIRATGADNLILVPGNGWTGAHSWMQNWYGTSNATVMGGITDPANNFAFDVHQYLDSDSSGTSSNIVSATIGQERLVAVTNWLRDNNRKAFLGEFAVANSTIGAGIGDEAIANMLNYMDNNDDVWLGWTWWAGGPWWGNYRFTIEPTNLGLPNEADRPVLGAIQPFFAQKEPPADSADFDGDGDVDGRDFLIWQRGHGLDGQEDSSNGDANGNTYVDQIDLEIWQAQYGISPPITATQVPEPSSLILILLAVLEFLKRSCKIP